jgi:hypothetical protein
VIDLTSLETRCLAPKPNAVLVSPARDTMLSGYVDVVSADRIIGWAFDRADPDRRVDIIIFLDGHKIGQVTCDLDRPDLKKSGKHGDGKHAFVFEFSDPIATVVERTISIRYAENGRPLANGLHKLVGGTDTNLPPFKAMRPEQFMRVPCPIRPRQLFETLSLYSPYGELYDLLAQINYDGCDFRNVFFSTFGRLPGSLESAGTLDDLNELLLSSDFQSNVLRIFLEAYPEKRRLLFVHIPKCAGSDLSANLATKYPSISWQITQPEWTSKQELFCCLRDIVLRLRLSDAIFVRGHIPLPYYSRLNLIRPGDEVFTILREPLEIIISRINYVLTRFQRNEGKVDPDPDVKDWLQSLGLSSVPASLTVELARRFAERMIYNESIVTRNPLCNWLGGGAATAVLKRLALNRVEVTDTARYQAWLHKKWAIKSKSRENASEQFVTSDFLNPEDLTYVKNICEEDIKLYRAVCDRLSSHSTTSIQGDELLEVIE